MTTFSPETYAAAEDYFAALEQAKYLYGYFGRPNGDGTITYYSETTPGKVYVRVWRGEQLTIAEATNFGAILDPNLLVRMMRVRGELVVDMPDPTSARELYGHYAAGASAPPRIDSPIIGTTDPVADERLKHGRVRAKGDGSMNIIIERVVHKAAVYPGENAASAEYDVTSHVPATTNKRLPIVPCIDWTASPPELVIVEGGETDLLANQIADTEIAAIAIPSGYTRLDAVILYEGMTTTDNAVVVPMRWLIVPQGGTGDASEVTYTPDDAGDYPEGAPDDVAEALDILAARTTSGGGAEIHRAHMWHFQSLKTAGSGSMTNTTDASSLFNILSALSSPADGDEFTNGFYLSAGTYTFVAVGLTSTDKGMIDWDVDGSSIGTGQDWYNGSTQRNQAKTIGSVVIAADGWHVLTGTVNGKNASSSGYGITLQMMYFVPAAD